MLGLFKKKKINIQKVTAFKDAVNAINVFILISEWEKAKHSLIEIRTKEKESFDKLISQLEHNENELIDNNFVEKQKETYIDTLNKRLKILDNLEHKIEVKEKTYIAKNKKESFKIRFKKVKTEIEGLTGNKKNQQAINLLQTFLEDHKEMPSVIRFFNIEKKIILKNVEKQQRQEQEKVKKNAKLEALRLIGVNIDINAEEEKNKDKQASFFSKFTHKISFYKKLKEKIKRKKLLDEISILIEEDSKVKKDIAERKLANIHKGLIKELNNDTMLGYDLYGKILGADKISGDTFGFYEGKQKYNFFLGDATGHGIRAGFIITLLSRLFTKYVEKSDLKELTYEINNGLKQDLQSRNFITGVLFEVDKREPEKIHFVGMGHEPMLLYRSRQKAVEKIIPGGLAAGIRMIKDKIGIKIKEIRFEDGDVLMTYSDGIIETKNFDGEFYGINNLMEVFQEVCQNETHVPYIYDKVMAEVKIFRGGSHFDDDTSVLLVKRDIDKDIVAENSKYLVDLSMKEGLKKSQVKKLEGKTKQEIEIEIESIRKVKETNRVIKLLEQLYYTGEILKLKQEAVRFIKEGYIHKKINFYLKKAIDNEKKYKIEQKSKKIENKYNVLAELYKKGDYKTVMQEAEEIISKDGNV